MQLVGQTAHRALERFKLLIQIGAQPFQLDRLGQFLGGDFLVMGGVKHDVIRIGLRDRRGRGRFKRRFALGHLCLFAHFLFGHFVHRDLRLGHVLLIFLGLLGIGLAVFLAVILAGAVGIVMVFGVFLGVVLLIVVHFVGIVAKLVAIAQIVDDLAGKPGKALLVGQSVLQVVQMIAGALLDKAAPQVHHVIRARRQVAPGGEVPDQVARRDG